MARPRSDGRPPREPVRRNLTEMYLRSLKPAAEPYQVYDTKQGGLVLQIQPSGHRAWKCPYSIRGKTFPFHIGDASAIALSDARRLAARVMLRVADGAHPHAERMAQRSGGTFEELVRAYLLREGAGKSTDQYERLLRRAVARWGKMPAGAVTRADVKRLFADRKKESTSAAKLLVAVIGSVYSWALHEDWSGVTINPARDIASTRHDKSLKAKPRERVLSDAELPLSWNAWEAAGLLRCNALRVVLLSGQRPGECRHMRWEDIVAGEHEFERDGRKSTHTGAWWTMPGSPDGRWPGTKNGHSHAVWLTPAVLALLHEVCGDRRDGLVFATARGNPIDHLDATMREACASLGLDHATPHDLRRTRGTLVTRLGFTRDAMNRLQNHREGGIGSVYDRFDYADEARAIQERVGAMVAHLVTGEPDPRVVDLDQRRAQRV